jgi:hypothetical protein
MTHIDRRTAIQLSAKGMVALMASLPLLKACAAPGATGAASGGINSGAPPLVDAGPIPWDHFLEQVAALAEVQFTDDWDQAGYTADVQRLMQRLNLADPFLLDAYANYANNVRAFPEIDTIYHHDSFEVATLQFEAGETIDLHDHPDMTGVIMCISGTVDVENFTLLDEASPQSDYLLERTARWRMRDLDVGTLTATTSNIHGLQAIEFTQMLDVFTPPYNDDRSQRSRWFRRAAQPLANRPDVFEAWRR